MSENDDRYQGIISQAYAVFMQHGIKNVSMDDLCRQMGISKKTLYRYVENKADLVGKINKHIQHLITNRLKEVEGMELNAIDVLLEMSRLSSSTHIRINPMVSYEIRKYYPQVYDDYICTKKDLIVSSILKNLDQGIREGLYRDDLNREIVAHLYFKKIEEFHTLEAENLRDFSYSKVFEVMFENHIRGIANEKGIAYFEKQKEKLNFNL